MSPERSQPSGAGRKRRRDGNGRGKWLWIGLGIVAIGLIVRFWPSPTENLRDALAERWGEDAKSLYLNLPPRPKRYPGSVFTVTHGAPVALVDGMDADLQRGEPIEFEHEAKELGKADGSLGAAVFEAVARKSTELERSVEIPDLRSIEMEMRHLASRVRGLGWTDTVPADFRVVLRAYEGHLTYRLKRRETFSVGAWATFMEELREKALSDSTIRLSFEGSSGREDVGVITTATAIVIAYQVIPASFVLKMSPGQPIQPAPAQPPVEDVRGALERLLLLDSARVPAFDQALREIGPPKAVKAVLDTIARGRVPATAATRDRAKRVLDRVHFDPRG